MNETVARILYKAGCRARGTPVLGHLSFLERSQWWDAGKMREWRLVRARRLLKHARANSPFYADLFNDAGFDPSIGSLDELKSLPPVDKATVKENKQSIQNSGSAGKLIFTKTSGSSGEPLMFYRSTAWDTAHRAAILRGLGWYGVKPWMRSGMLWGLYPDLAGRIKARAGDFVQNRFRQKRFELSAPVLKGFLEKLRGAAYLEGYPSFIYELARFVNSGGWQRNPDGTAAGIDLSLIKATSEKIYDYYQAESLRAFGQRVRGEYGAAESGIIAFECPEGNYHVNMEHVIVEEEDGEILVTNLLSDSFPFIRYRLGDAVKIAESGLECPCGRKGVILKEILGRAGGNIVGMGKKDFPAITIEYIIRDLEARTGLIAQCQGIQKEAGYLDFLVRPVGGRMAEGAAGLGSFVEGLLKDYFGEHLRCRVEIVDRIPRRKGKYLQFVSEISGRSAPV